MDVGSALAVRKIPGEMLRSSYIEATRKKKFKNLRRNKKTLKMLTRKKKSTMTTLSLTLKEKKSLMRTLKEKKVLMKDFLKELEQNEAIKVKLGELREEVEAFASSFDMPGSE